MADLNTDNLYERERVDVFLPHGIHLDDLIEKWKDIVEVEEVKGKNIFILTKKENEH